MKGQPLKPGEINYEVYDQADWWWDMRGFRHNVTSMDPEYALNVLCFSFERHAQHFDAHESPLIQTLRKRVLNPS
jgi:hypothetical protein